jgi:hypothetical protein
LIFRFLSLKNPSSRTHSVAVDSNQKENKKNKENKDKKDEKPKDNRTKWKFFNLRKHVSFSGAGLVLGFGTYYVMDQYKLNPTAQSAPPDDQKIIEAFEDYEKFNTVDIRGLDKIEVIYALWKNSFSAAFFQFNGILPPEWDRKVVEIQLKKTKGRLDYVLGRQIKITFQGDTINVAQYNTNCKRQHEKTGYYYSMAQDVIASLKQNLK